MGGISPWQPEPEGKIKLCSKPQKKKKTLIRNHFFVYYRFVGLWDESHWLSEQGVLGACPSGGSLASWGDRRPKLGVERFCLLSWHCAGDGVYASRCVSAFPARFQAGDVGIFLFAGSVGVAQLVSGFVISFLCCSFCRVFFTFLLRFIFLIHFSVTVDIQY